MELIYYPAPHCVRCPAKLALSTLSTAGLGHSQSPSRRDLGRCSPSPVMVMAAMQHFSLPSPLCSPLLPPWLSLIYQLVVVSMPPPLVLSTLPPPQPLPINNPAASCHAASALHHLSLHSRLLCLSSTPPLRLQQLVVASHLTAPPLPLNLNARPAHMLPLAAALPHIRQHALSRTSIFVASSANAAAIAGVLKCMVHPPDGGIANGYCPFLFGSRPLTRPPAPPHCPLCFCRQGEDTAK